MYTVDLSDPTNPRVRGELKILGYSAYLHPVGDGLLLGVGQDASKQGRIRGTQISLFDISDLDDPTRLHAERLGRDTHSEVEYDHHAFLWWPARSLAVLPVYGYGFDERAGETWTSSANRRRGDPRPWDRARRLRLASGQGAGPSLADHRGQAVHGLRGGRDGEPALGVGRAMVGAVPVAGIPSALFHPVSSGVGRS